MTDEERAVWIGERLFGIIYHEDDDGFMVSIAEMSPYLEDIFYDNGNLYTERYIEWLSSPEGIASIIDAMIHQGWEYVSQYTQAKGYEFSFGKGKNICHTITGTRNLNEAVLAAAEKALRAEL